MGKSQDTVVVPGPSSDADTGTAGGLFPAGHDAGTFWAWVRGSAPLGGGYGHGGVRGNGTASSCGASRGAPAAQIGRGSTSARSGEPARIRVSRRADRQTFSRCAMTDLAASHSLRSSSMAPALARSGKPSGRRPQRCADRTVWPHETPPTTAAILVARQNESTIRRAPHVQIIRWCIAIDAFIALAISVHLGLVRTYDLIVRPWARPHDVWGTGQRTLGVHLLSPACWPSPLPLVGVVGRRAN